MANVTCEYEDATIESGSHQLASTIQFDVKSASIQNRSNSSNSGGDPPSGRRVRRSEAILRQAADCVSRGQTFQMVSDMFNIPISTIR